MRLGLQLLCVCDRALANVHAVMGAHAEQRYEAPRMLDAWVGRPIAPMRALPSQAHFTLARGQADHEGPIARGTRGFGPMVLAVLAVDV